MVQEAEVEEVEEVEDGDDQIVVPEQHEDVFNFDLVVRYVRSW
jgi:hypothetical protein